MRKFLCLALGVVATLVAMVGCSYNDEAIWETIGEIESDVEQNRKDIETLTALIEALNGGKAIIATETTDEGVVLTFSDGSTITIYHGTDGEDGKDGANGKDGEDGEDGESLFESIEESDTEVIITLTDGRVIRIPKYNPGGEEDDEVLGYEQIGRAHV